MVGEVNTRSWLLSRTQTLKKYRLKWVYQPKLLPTYILAIVFRWYLLVKPLNLVISPGLAQCRRKGPFGFVDRWREELGGLIFCVDKEENEWNLREKKQYKKKTTQKTKMKLKKQNKTNLCITNAFAFERLRFPWVSFIFFFFNHFRRGCFKQMSRLCKF